MMKHGHGTVVLILAALVLAGHVVLPVRADASSSSQKGALLTTKSAVFVEAKRSGKKLPPIKSSTLDDGELANLADLTDAGDIKASVEESFDLAASSKKGYAAFLADLDFHVNATAARWISLHPVLGKQQLHAAPATLLKITVTGDGDDRVAFFMRSDNLYILGFANKHGRLFAFRVQGGQYRMPASTPLSFGGGYPDMFGQGLGARGLLTVMVNKKQAEEHLKTLANHQGGADQELKLPLAFFVLTISEAERFGPIREAVMERWEDAKARNIGDAYSAGTLLVDLVVNWRTFSCAILGWYKNGQTPAAWRANSEGPTDRKSLRCRERPRCPLQD